MAVIVTEVTPTATSTPTSTVHVNTTDGISQQVPTTTGMYLVV